MGSGKTTTGEILAVKLGYRFVDMDQEIEQEQGVSINEIFASGGEASFRKLEESLLRKIIEQDNLVVATGGGVPCYGDNMKVINAHGISIYLKMKQEELFSRLMLEKNSRPLIKDMDQTRLSEFIRVKLAEREPFYKLAAIIVDAAGINPDDLLSKIRNT